jgi:aspartyl-tRNA(Asn)/glutamyl-tRNA(Gln) amidotransferase subunit C
MDVKHVAKLANLQLLPGEEEKFTKQFADTLQTLSLIEELDTTEVEPTAQVTGLVNVFREDVIDQSRILSQSQVLAQAKSSQDGFVKVPAIFDAQ